MQAAAEQNKDRAWPDQRSLYGMTPHAPSVFGDEMSSACVGGILSSYSAANGSTRGYSATFCTLVPGVSLPQAAS